MHYRAESEWQRSWKMLELVERNENLSAGSRCRVWPLELSIIGELVA